MDTTGLPSVDIHQHLWPPELIECLRARREPPHLDGWTLHVRGEPAYEVTPADHDVDLRARLDPANDNLLVSLSSPLGIEQLPAAEAQPLLAAWHSGASRLPGRFAAWASVHHGDPDHGLLKELLNDGFVGLQVPATQLMTPMAVERAADLLRVCELADRPVLVHPGPVAPDRRRDASTPGWWSAVVDYPAQMQAAWWAWHCAGRSLLPELRICFAAGAGLAPVHHERFAARAGHLIHIEPSTFVDTSSYGRSGLDSLIRVLGIDAIVMGSDRPYAVPTDPELGAAATHAVRVSNPHRLLEGGQPCLTRTSPLCPSTACRCSQPCRGPG